MQLKLAQMKEELLEKVFGWRMDFKGLTTIPKAWIAVVN